MVSLCLLLLSSSCSLYSPLSLILTITITFVVMSLSLQNNSQKFWWPVTLVFLHHPLRGGLPRGTGPRCLPETARLRGVPNPGEGLPSRVSGQLPGGSRRTEHLLHPPPQQTQEIHLPVHWRLLLCPGSGESGQVRLYKVFLIKEKKEKKRDNTLGRFSPLQICFVFLPALLVPRTPLSKVPFPSEKTLRSPPPTNPVFFLKTLKKVFKKTRETTKKEFLSLSVLDWWLMLPRWGCWIVL